MKSLLTLLTLPVIFLIVFFGAKFYLNGQFFAAYAFVLGWLLSFTLWIRNVGLLLEQQPRAAAPRAPRAYLSK